ncbi:MAG: winged helix-turn-helix transcriptional regulator [Parcubacteria group bacterium]|nr:winged helix-turn-helix transcriptional regulator [Parcubacteria group bacterium]
MLSKAQIENIRHEKENSVSPLPSIFKGLGDKTRFQIFMLLQKHGELCVTDVARIFSISVPAASHQLKILEMTGLVRRTRMGQMICYEVETKNPVVHVINHLAHA